MKIQRRAVLVLFDAIALLMMLVISVLQFNVSIPSGTLHIAIVGLVSIALMALTDIVNGIIVTAISFVAIGLFGIMHWQTLLPLGILVAIMAIIIATSLPHHQRLSHQQTIWLGLAAGICQLVLFAIIYFILGWHYFNNFRGAVVELQQVFPAALLSGLLDSLLLPPIIFSGAKLADKLGLFNHPNNDGDQDPLLFDLSSHDKDNQDDSQHDKK